jgi:hypothetical protein
VSFLLSHDKLQPDRSFLTRKIPYLQTDVIGQCAFSYDFDALRQGKEKHPYVKAIYACTDRIYDRAFNVLLYPEWNWKRSAAGKEYYRSCDIIHDVSQNHTYTCTMHNVFLLNIIQILLEQCDLNIAVRF